MTKTTTTTDSALNLTQGEIQDQAGGDNSAPEPSSFAPGEETPQATPETPQDSPQGDETPKDTRDDLDALRAENDALRGQLLKAQVQARHGISDEDARLFLTGADEATLTEQAEALTKRANANPGPVVPSQKNHPTGATRNTDPVRGLLRR
jgi:hypothetical protein